jgi:hypothetical protein
MIILGALNWIRILTNGKFNLIDVKSSDLYQKETNCLFIHPLIKTMF